MIQKSRFTKKRLFYAISLLEICKKHGVHGEPQYGLFINGPLCFLCSLW
jgi:hypothetical protein